MRGTTLEYQKTKSPVEIEGEVFLTFANYHDRCMCNYGFKAKGRPLITSGLPYDSTDSCQQIAELILDDMAFRSKVRVNPYDLLKEVESHLERKSNTDGSVYISGIQPIDRELYLVDVPILCKVRTTHFVHEVTLTFQKGKYITPTRTFQFKLKRRYYEIATELSNEIWRDCGVVTSAKDVLRALITSRMQEVASLPSTFKRMDSLITSLDTENNMVRIPPTDTMD